MKLAIIKTGGKQYKVKENDVVSIEKLPGEAGEKVVFPTLATFDEKGDNLNLGLPMLGDNVTGEIINTAKGDKISVIKFKNKTRYRRNVGHRQFITKVKITNIK